MKDWEAKLSQCASDKSSIARKTEDQIWRVTFLKKDFTLNKKKWGRLPVFMQETIYHVRTEMTQSLGFS